MLQMNQPSSITFSPGQCLDKYELLRELGQGQFGEVWLANDQALAQEFAVKILKPGISVDQRLQEAKIGSRLKHNNLAHVHCADVINVKGHDLVVLAMDYQQNGSLEKMANSAGFVTLPHALQIARDVLQGLEYLHTQNFLHNDIKPGNILIGEQKQFILSDYGIADVSLNGGPVIACGAYCLHRAPEVHATGEISVSSDIFQTGMTLLRLLLGLNYLDNICKRIGLEQYVHYMNNGKLVHKNIFPHYIPRAVQCIIIKSVHPDPSQRHSSPLEMRREIEKLNFPGYWNVDASGKEFGINGFYRYEYAMTNSRNINKFNLTCTRSDIRSGKTNRVREFCKKDLTEKETLKAIGKFQSFVVEGRRRKKSRAASRHSKQLPTEHS